MIKRLVWKFICPDKNNDKNKTNLPLPPSTPVTLLLIAEKLLSDFKVSVCFLIIFCKNFSIIVWVDCFYCKFVGGG